ncbi:MAG: hypothetical protein BGP16_11775 [Sphingobium sp. 66-54]|nr:MAG: hypothetical protein BGP16_11775 [Sphingobium sp. 66-54]
MSNSISIPYQGDALDIAVAEAEAKLIVENTVGIVFGYMIGDDVEVIVEFVDNANEAMTKYAQAANRFMQRANKPDLPMDVVTRPVGWNGLDAALIRELVKESHELMAF